jgi:hypothetical protein
MAQKLGGSNLATQLSLAIKDYEARWQSVDVELYDLCRRRASHRDFADVYTKVAVIGRVYQAGISRAFRASGDPEATVARGLVDQAELIEEQSAALGGRVFDRSTVLAIVELHGRITRGLAACTGNVWLTSFVSKYLHFHCSIVPVYDANAAGSIRHFVDRQAAASVRDSMVTLQDCAKAYRNFASAFVVLYERVWDETPLQPSVKEMDHLLWQS